MSGKVAIVTGGAGALGRAVCRVFLENGARVVAADRAAGALSELLEDPVLHDRISFHETDVLSDSSVLALMQSTVGELGSIDILAHIVGGFAGGSLAETPLATWEKMLALNATSAFLCFRHALPIMQRQKSGRLIAVGARPALEPAVGSAAYSVSKAAVLHLVRTAAVEGKEHGITANAVLPGIIDTPANREAMPNSRFTDWTSAERIARVILFLAGEAGADTSGALVPVYGRS